MFKSPFLLLICAFASAQAEAATYYVAPGGQDSNAGSQSNPWATISHAASIAGAGDTVNVATGTYSGAVTISSKGSAASPVLFVCAGSPVLTNQLTINGSYITVSGLTVSPPGSGYGSAIDISGTHNLLSHCTVANYGATASDQATMVSTDGTFNQIDRCNLSNANDIDVFHVWGDHITISNNTVTKVNVVNYAKNHTDFVQTWGLQSSQRSTFIYIYGNIVHDATADIGNTETDGNPNLHDWYIYNNIFYNVDSSLFSGLPNTWVFNNIFMLQGSGGAGVSLDFYTDTAGSQSGGSTGFSYNSAGSKVQNNAFIAGSGDIGTGGNAGTLNGMTISNNYFSSSASTWASENNPVGTSFVNGGKPLFTSVPALNFTINNGSVFIGKGANLSSIFTTDKDGNPRPSSGAWDIGPYQSASSGAPSAPTGLKIVQ